MGQSISKGLLAVILAVAAAGCAVAVEQTPPSPPIPREVLPMKNLKSVTASVLADAAKRTGLDRTSLEVKSAQAVTWPDGSLGCPQPGMNYTMALVPGYRIRVRAGEVLLDYHASLRGHFVLCPAGMAVEPAPDATR